MSLLPEPGYRLREVIMLLCGPFMRQVKRGSAGRVAIDRRHSNTKSF